MRDLLLDRKGTADAPAEFWPCNHCGRPTEAGPFAQAIEHLVHGDGRGPMGRLAICPGCYEELREQNLERVAALTAKDAQHWAEFRAKYLKASPDAVAMREALRTELIARVYQKAEYELLATDWERIVKEREAKRPRKARGEKSDDSGF